MRALTNKGEANPSGLRAAEFQTAGPAFVRAVQVAQAVLAGASAEVMVLVEGEVWRSGLKGRRRGGPAPRPQPVDDGVAWIADAAADPLAGQAIVATGALKLRFLAAAPIRLANGEIIGALQATGPKPRPFDPDIAEALQNLAGFVSAECDRLIATRRGKKDAADAKAPRDNPAGFVEGSPAAVVMTDRSLRIMHASPGWRRDMRLDGKSVAGKSLDDFFPGVRERWSDAWTAALAGEAQSADRVRLKAADGSELWVQVKIAPWRDASGAVGGLTVLTNNVTEVVASLEQASRSERRLALAASLSDLHVWELDFRAETLFKVGAHDNFFQKPIAYEDLRANPWCAVHPDDLERCKIAWDLYMAEGVPYRIEHRIKRDDGREMWVFSTTEFFADEEGRPLRLVGAMQNITQRRAAEAEAARGREAAEQANKAKSEFLANMSHEIRTPLNGVMGVAGVLARTPLTTDQREMVGLIESSAQTLEGLLTDVLDLARIESGRLELRIEPFDLGACLRQTAALFAAGAQSKDLKLETDIAPQAQTWVEGDVVRLRQILSNLLSNAVKFTAEGGVTLAARAENGREGLKVTIAVHDTGIGFDDETRTRLFQRFEQADGSITRRFGGTGLGLSISRSLAEAMAGSLDVVSTPGVGSTFTLSVTLPLAEGQACEAFADEPAPANEAAGARRILLAEDHPTNRRVVQLILEALHVDITCVEDGAQAVAAAAERDFDLILMDMQMPVMDGLTAIRAIRKREAAAGLTPVRIISLTANAMPEHARECLAAGADGHLTKPIAAEKLIAAVLEADAEAAPEALSA